MMLKEIINLRKKTSILDTNKLPQTEPTSLSPQLRTYFNSIFDFTYKSIERLDCPYDSSSDPCFVARCHEVEWMFSAQVVFNMSDDTIFLAILILDKVLSLRGTSNTEMDKLARVALILASKQNDVSPLKLAKVNQISRTPFTISDYIDLEAQILMLLDFELPQGTLYELFKLYQITFKLESVLKDDAVIAVLKKCILDYKLIQYGVKASALASLTHLCCLKRILINTAVITDACHYYDQALERIDDSLKEVKHKKRSAAPKFQQTICV